MTFYFEWSDEKYIVRTSLENLWNLNYWGKLEKLSDFDLENKIVKDKMKNGMAIKYLLLNLM
jgi:hypothetical protein